MKKVLLLGGFGFLGSNILKHIDLYNTKDYQVIVFDRFDKHPEGIQFDCLTKTYAGDFSDKLALEQVFKQEKIDLVIHAISTTLPALPFSARFDIESNLVPSVELLNIMLKHEVQEIVYISSGGAVYGNKPEKHSETDNLYPISSYGIVKLAIEKYMLQYASLYDIKPMILRLSNPYGRYHYSTRQGICNVASRKAVSESDFSVWGDGNAMKDYIFVEDFASILFRLLDTNKLNEIVNISSGEMLSVNQILSEIKKHVPSFKWGYSEPSRFDVQAFELDNSKLISMIGEFNFTSISDGLSKTIGWLTGKNEGE